MSKSLQAPALPRPAGSTSARNGLICLALTGIIWGTTGVAADLVYRASDLGPLAVSFWRNFGGLVLLLAVAAWLPVGFRRRISPGPLRGRLLLLIGTGIGTAIFQAAYYAAVQSTGVAIATVVCLGSGPILTSLGGRLLLGERIGRGGALAVAGALTGLAVLVLGDQEGTVHMPGIALALLSASGYASVGLLSRWTGRHGDGEDPFTLTVWAFGVGAVLLLPLAWAEGLLPQSGDVGRVALLMVYSAVVTSALAYPLYFAGTGAVRATTAAVMILIEPVSAAILAVVVLGEHLTPTTVVGTLLLLAAITGLAKAESRIERAAV